MFTSVRVDGFRSLIDFEIALSPGLNVFVGANGTGKSNFISFLDFLSAFIGENLNTAVAVAQGAGSVFSKERFSDEEATLSFSIAGEWAKDDNPEQHHWYSDSQDEGKIGSYIYECTIKYLKAVPAVYVSTETFKTTSDKASSITIIRNTNRVEKNFKSHIVVDAPSSFKERLLGWQKHLKEQRSVEELYADRASPDRTVLMDFLGDSTALTHSIIDLFSYRSVNIDPSLSRKPTQVGSTIQLMPTGEGLAGALYHLKRGTYVPNNSLGQRIPLLPERSQVSFESIVSWCKEVNPSIQEIDVTLDFMEAQLRPSIIFKFGRVMEQFTFARISDGTVKWTALVTMILAEPNLNVIEEPENFLHPQMQESFIILCRQVINMDNRRTILISTHSPTLLDCCEPHELRMFELVDGHTMATTPANYRELADKISRSRFGLGHYYRTGALHG